MMSGVLAMIQQQCLYLRVMLQNPNEFRPAVAGIADDGNPVLQMCIYSFL
jgi:hypothetical protein